MKSRFLVGMFVAFIGCGDTPSASFRCTDDVSCTLATKPGICIDKGSDGKGVCALSDSACSSGYRYDATAGEHADECVVPSVVPDMSNDLLAADMTTNTTAPAISTISPSMGPTSGGSSITIVGTGFAAGATVAIAGKPAVEVKVPNAQTITALSPAAPSGTTGMVTLTVTNPDGQSASGSFTYIPTAVTFAAAPSSPTVTNPLNVVVADFNADGKKDLGVSGTAGFSVFLGNGDGTFGAAAKSVNGSFAVSAALADINVDGKIDAVVLTGKSVFVLLGLGDGTFQAPKTFTVDASLSSGSSVAVADFNGDTKLDIAVTLNLGTGKLVELLGDGTGNFTAHPSSPFAFGMSPSSIVSGDFNGDGNRDLISLGVSQNTVKVSLGNGDGSFQAQVPYTLTGNAYSVVFADLNVDGKQDLVVGVNPNALNILFGKADGTFEAPQSVALSASLIYPNSVAIADFNGDGKPDVMAAGGGGANTGFSATNVMLGKGGALFDVGPTPIPGKEPISVGIGDFNDDGKVDAAVANYNGQNVIVFLNTSM
jgi:hypothetical protein